MTNLHRASPVHNHQRRSSSALEASKSGKKTKGLFCVFKEKRLEAAGGTELNATDSKFAFGALKRGTIQESSPHLSRSSCQTTVHGMGTSDYSARVGEGYTKIKWLVYRKS